MLSKMLQRLRLAGKKTTLPPAGWEKNGLARPSWVEEFRTYRALWTLQTHSDLRRAISSQPTTEHGSWGGWNWSQDDVWKVEHSGYSPLFDMPNNSETITHPLLAPEIQGVAEVLAELGASCHPFPRVEKGILEECTSAIIFYSMETPKAAKFPVWSAPPMAPHPECGPLADSTPSARRAVDGFVPRRRLPVWRRQTAAFSETWSLLVG